MRFLGSLLLALSITGAAHAASAEHAEKPAKAYLSLIIDDLGQNPERDSRTLALPGPVTLAIMPDTRTPPISPARLIAPVKR